MILLNLLVQKRQFVKAAKKNSPSHSQFYKKNCLEIVFSTIVKILFPLKKLTLQTFIQIKVQDLLEAISSSWKPTLPLHPQLN